MKSQMWLWVVAITLSANANAQSTWKVNCQGGPGIDYTDLPTAVAAASAGDTIIVIMSGGSCSSSHAVNFAPTIDKPLSILGLALYSPPPVPGSAPTVASLMGVITVSGIPAGQRVLLSNLTAGVGSPALPLGGLRILNCAGEIVVDGLWCSTGGYPNQVLEVINSSNVTLKNCTFYFGPSPLRIVNSTVRMSWSVMQCFVPPAQFGGYPETQPAIDLESSTLTLTGSSITGANEMLTSYGWWFAKAGIVLDNSVLNIGPGTTLRGGYSGGSYGGAYQPKYLWSAPSVIRRDSRTTLPTQYWPAPILVDQSATYTHPAVANQDVGVVMAGPVGGFAMLLLSDLAPGPTMTPFGSTLLDPLATTAVDIHYLPASTGGFASKYYFVPSTARNAHAYVVQSLTLSPAGELGFTMPMPFTVGWEHGRIP